MTTLAASTLSRLECGNCGRVHEALKLQGLCGRCDRPLLARYDLGQAAATLKLPEMAGRRPDMWRYGEVLPLAGEPVSLGFALVGKKPKGLFGSSSTSEICR